MNKTLAVLGTAGVLLLSGCMMMGGLGHAHGLAEVDMTSRLERWRTTSLQERAETSSGGLTADARARAGEGLPTVSVTTRAEVGAEADSHWPGWWRPAALLAGLGMVVTMVVMMGGSTF